MIVSPPCSKIKKIAYQKVQSNTKKRRDLLTVLISSPLSEQEARQLKKEFPRFNFLHFPRQSLEELPIQVWEKVEILYGERLSSSCLTLAENLKWIHVPSSQISRLCLAQIEERKNILLSYTPDANSSQIGEYVLGVLLAFAKNLFHWKAVNQYPTLVWDSKWRNSMWSLEGKTFLQIGIGKTGIEILKRAKNAGMQTWGIENIPTLHPYCDQTFSLSDLPELLPKADAVSLTIPDGLDKTLELKLTKNKLSQMKDDSILIIIGGIHHIDETALANLAKKGKFRGILIDAHYQIPVPIHSKLWSISNLLLTPGASPRPKIESHESFKIFRFNLRQYLYGNFSEMQHLTGTKLAEINDI